MITLVVPCFNEAERLDFAQFREALIHDPRLRLVFVDDGSTDGTAARLEALCADLHPRASLVRLAANRGKGEAIRHGILSATPRAGEYFGYWDADLSTPLPMVSEMAAVLDGDPGLVLVLGSRVQLLGRSVKRRASRHYLGRVFAMAVSLMLRLRVYDTQCGAKLFRATDASLAAFRDPFRSRWLFDVEVLFRLLGPGRRRMDDPAPGLYELPLRAWQDVAGSKVTGREMLRAALELWRVLLAYRVSQRAAGISLT